MSSRRTGKWHIEYEFGGATYTREADDERLLHVLGDRYGIVNKVVYVGPEVEITNMFVDKMMRGDTR